MSTPPQYMPPGSVVPPPMSVPAPTATALTPSWGTNPYQPTATSSFWGGAAPVGSTASVINTLGMPVAAPEELTPEELQANIESGLAKLDTVNPELAAQMRAEHGLGGDDGGGAFGFLGDIKDAVLGGAGKVLELIGRSAHVVPALIDPESWDDGNSMNDAWDALMGRNKTNWNEVLQHSGWSGEGVSGVLRAGVGFAGDVLTDPLTYATFGAGAGASVAEKGALTAKTVSTKLGTFTDDAIRLGVGTNGDEAAEALTRVYNAMSKAPSRTEQAAQALASQAGRAVDDGYRQLAADMFEAADNVYNAVYGRAFSTWLRKGEKMTLESGRVIDPTDVKALIEQTVKDGIGKAPKSAEWLHARAAAGAMGGARFAPYIPFTQFRYISPMLPGSNALQPLARTARFMAGKSSSKQMEKLIRAGTATWDDMALLHQRGLQALRESSDPAQRRVFEMLTAHGRGSSAFYSASERVGGITARFAKGSQLNRMGLGGYFIAQHAKALKGNLDHIEHHLLYDVVGQQAKDKGLTGRDYLFRLLKDTWGITDDAGSLEDFDLISRYMDYFGGLEDVPSLVDEAAFDQWFWNRRDIRSKLNATADAEGQVSEAARGELQAQLDDMKAVLREVPEGPKRDVLEALASVERRGNDVVNEYGVPQANSRVADLDSVKEIHRDDAHLFNGGAHESAREGTWYVTLQNRRMGLTDEDVLGHGDLGVAGVRASRSPSEGAVEVAVNPRKVLVVGEGETVSSTILNDSPILRDAYERAQAQMQALKEAVEAQGNPILPVSPLHESNWDDTLAKLVTDDLRNRGGLEYDAILFRGRPEGDELVLLGTKEVDPWSQAKVLNDNAPRIAPTRGYFHRTFTKEAQEFLHGVYGDKAVHAVRDLASKSRRKAHGMTFNEAEEQARKVIVEELQKQGAPQSVLDRVADMPLFERNPLKVHKDYVRGVAETVNGVMTGELSERINALGELLPTRFGRYAAIDTARYEVDQALLRAVAQASPKVAEAASRFQAKERKLMAAMAKAADEDADRLAEVLAAWQRGEDVDLANLATSNPKLKRLLDAAEDKAAVIAREREKALKTKAVIEQRLSDLEAVERLLNEEGKLWRSVEDAVDETEHMTWEDLPEGAARPPKRLRVGADVLGDGPIVWRSQQYEDLPTEVPDYEELETSVSLALRDIGAEPEEFASEVRFIGEGGQQVHAISVSDIGDIKGAEVVWENGTKVRLTLGEDGFMHIDEATLVTDEVGGNVIEVYHGTPYAFDEPLTGRMSKGGGRAGGAGGDLVGPEHYVTTSGHMAGKGYAKDEGADVQDLLYPDDGGELESAADSALESHPKGKVPPSELDDDQLRDMAATLLMGIGRADNEWGPMSTLSEVIRTPQDPGSAQGRVGVVEEVIVEDAETGIAVTMKYRKVTPEVEEYWRQLYGGAENFPLPPEGWSVNQVIRFPQTAPNVRKGVLRLPKGSVYFADEVLDEATMVRLRDGLQDYVGHELLERTRIEARRTALNTQLDERLRKGDKLFKDIDALRKMADDLRAQRDSLPVASPEAEAAHQAALNTDEAIKKAEREAVAFTKETKAFKAEQIDPLSDQLAALRQANRGKPAPSVSQERAARLLDKVQRELDNEAARKSAADMGAETASSGFLKGGANGGTGMDMWYELVDTFASDHLANDFLERLGYEAIHYNGGARLGGGHSHEAFGIFNPTKTIVHHGNWQRHAAEAGVMTRDDLARLLDNGELGVAADGTVLTRSGRARQAGKGGARKVHPRAELEAEARRVGQLLHDLDQADRQRSLAFAFGAEESGLPAPVARAQAKVERAIDQVSGQVTRESTSRAKNAAKNARRVERVTREATLALNELNVAVAAAEGVQAPLKPAVIIGAASQAGARTGMRQVNIPGLDDVWVHEFMAEELDSIFRGKPVGALRGAWREFVLTPWKKWATYRSPGFHVRNAFGAWFNNHLGGVTKVDYDFAHRVMMARDNYKGWGDKVITDEEFRSLGLHLNANFEGVTLKYSDIADMLADQGIGRANATSVALIEQTAREGSFLKVNAGRAVRGARKVDSTLRFVGATTEDLFRTAAWAAGMRATMGDVYGARAFVMVRHGDYADLTDTEEFIKDLVPFYKWMRTNVPYQLRTLAEEPGKLLMAQKLQRSIYDATGVSEEYQASQPDWMKRGLNIPLTLTGSDKAAQLTLDMPYGDLYKGAREYLSSILPIGMDVIESTALKQDTFTGMPLEGVTPLAGFFNLPGIRHLVSALPGTMTDPNGQVFIPRVFENVLSGLPVYGRFRNWVSGDPNRVEKRWGAITSYFFGVPVRGIDLTADEKAFFYDEVQPTLDVYTSMGYVFPTKEQLQDAGRLALTPTPSADTWWPEGTVGKLPTAPAEAAA
jgi:hypothetical protein